MTTAPVTAILVGEAGTYNEFKIKLLIQLKIFKLISALASHVHWNRLKVTGF